MVKTSKTLIDIEYSDESTAICEGGSPSERLSSCRNAASMPQYPGLSARDQQKSSSIISLTTCRHCVSSPVPRGG